MKYNTMSLVSLLDRKLTAAVTKVSNTKNQTFFASHYSPESSTYITKLIFTLNSDFGLDIITIISSETQDTEVKWQSQSHTCERNQGSNCEHLAQL